MTCRLLRAEPLPEPSMTHCHLDTRNSFSEIWIKIQSISFSKNVWNICAIQNACRMSDYFFPTNRNEICLINCLRGHTIHVYLINYHYRLRGHTIYGYCILYAKCIFYRDVTYGVTVSYMQWPNEGYGYFLLSDLRQQTVYPNLNLEAIRYIVYDSARATPIELIDPW